MTRSRRVAPGLPTGTPFAVSARGRVLAAMAGCVLKKPPDAAAHQGARRCRRSRSRTQWTAPALTRRHRRPTTGSRHSSDDQLTAAVAEAIANNADLRVGGRARRAGRALREARRREAVSVGRRARSRRRQDVGRQLGPAGRRADVTWELDLWGRVRYGRAAAAADADVGAGRLRVRAPVDGRARGQELVPGDRSRTAGGGGAAPRFATPKQLVRLAETRSRVGVGNDEDVYVARATVGTYRDALRQIELVARAGDPRARAAARPLPGGRRRCQRRSCRASPPRCQAGCRRSCSSAGPTSSPPSAASPPPSTASARPRPRGCRDRADDRRQLHLERSVRAQGSRQSGVELRREPASRRSTRAARSRRRSRSGRSNRSRRSPATRRSACARSARSRMRWPPRSRRAIASRS